MQGEITVPNGLPISEIMKLHKPREVPPIVSVMGKTVKFSPPRKTDWNRIAFCVWLVLFVIIPLTLGIITMIKDG